MTDAAPQRWPGERLGLPETGRRSIARLPRRIVGIVVDWALATLLSLAFFSTGEWQTDGFVTLAIFAALQIVFLLVVNGSIGHLIVGIRLVPIRGGRLAFWQPFVRTALLCLGIPALLWDADQRGLHDRAAATLLVNIR